MFSCTTQRGCLSVCQSLCQCVSMLAGWLSIRLSVCLSIPISHTVRSHTITIINHDNPGDLPLAIAIPPFVLFACSRDAPRAMRTSLYPPPLPPRLSPSPPSSQALFPPSWLLVGTVHTYLAARPKTWSSRTFCRGLLVDPSPPRTRTHSWARPPRPFPRSVDSPLASPTPLFPRLGVPSLVPLRSLWCALLARAAPFIFPHRAAAAIIACN